MTNSSVHERNNWEDSQSPRFSICDILDQWLGFCEAYNAANPDHPIKAPCTRCLRWLLYGRGHTHVTHQADDAGDSDLWDNVSPQSTFLSDHLPPIIAGPPSSTTHSSSIVPSTSATAATIAERRVTDRAPIEVGEHEHEYYCQNCGGREGRPNEGRSVPLSSALDLTALASSSPYHPHDRPAGTTETDVSVDISAVASADTSLSSLTASSGRDSLYTTPEHLNAHLPDDDDPTESRVAPNSVVVNPDPALIANIPPPPLPPTVATIGVPTPAPVAAMAGRDPALSATASLDPIAAVGGATPVRSYIPYFAPPSGSDSWYVVTCGRTVGVFDNSAQMQKSVANVPNGSGKKHPDRNDAIRAFLKAERDDVVKERFPPLR